VLGVTETFLLLIIAKNQFHIGLEQLQTVIFLKLVVSGHLTLFVARTRQCFLTRPFPAPMLLLAIIGTQIFAALIAGMGWFVTPIPWAYVGMIWAYCLFWVFVEDAFKLGVYRQLERNTSKHSRFLQLLSHSLHSHVHLGKHSNR